MLVRKWTTLAPLQQYAPQRPTDSPGRHDMHATTSWLLPAILSTLVSRDFLIAVAVMVALGLLLILAVRIAPRPEPTWHSILVDKCRAETKHRIDRKPVGPLAWTELLPRLRGVYSEQACRCGLKTRVRWIGSEHSKAGRDFYRDQW